MTTAVQMQNSAQPVRLTVAILTLNEEKRIARCIRSAGFADQIVVVSRFRFTRNETLETSVAGR